MEGAELGENFRESLKKTESNEKLGRGTWSVVKIELSERVWGEDEGEEDNGAVWKLVVGGSEDILANSRINEGSLLVAQTGQEGQVQKWKYGKRSVDFVARNAVI